ncbi:hypothetical protein PHISCL_09555 [Aspergillus sclerotialis]|uniref:Uncharacterized protein n=1 Tax=Aspergillus sclerotialis TaxID=2070753 RepID=A0A3A2Z4V9_9EURO|nr:hypothetical protein PHISCL_09555 [Aspergillus sclerotialis]
MPKKSRSPNWFEGELVLGQTVTFTTPVYSRWRVTEIIQDRQYSFIDTDPEESDVEVSINNSTPPTNSLHPQPSVYNAKVSIESAQPSIDKVEPKDGERSSIDTTPTASEGKPSSEKSEVEAGDRNPASAATSAAKEEEGGGGSGGGRTEKRRYEACAVFKCTRIDKDKNAQPTDQTGAAGLPRVGILKVRIHPGHRNHPSGGSEAPSDDRPHPASSEGDRSANHPDHGTMYVHPAPPGLETGEAEF